MQELTERSVSGRASGCTYWLRSIHSTVVQPFYDRLLKLRFKTSSLRKVLLKIYNTRNVYYSIYSKIFLEEEVLERSLRQDYSSRVKVQFNQREENNGLVSTEGLIWIKM